MVSGNVVLTRAMYKTTFEGVSMTTNNITVAELAPVTGASPAADEDPDDSSFGLAMFLTFTTAVLAITFAVCALAMVGSWWMLGVVYAADLIVTVLVFRVVLDALGMTGVPESESSEGQRQAGAAPAEAAVVALAAHGAPAVAHH